MKLVFLTPGTGSYHCGVCMRDNALAKEIIRQGHEALLLPMYLPLTLDEAPVDAQTPVFYGGISVYLQQKFALFRHTPRWLDKLLNAPGLLRLAARGSDMTSAREQGELTHSMLRGEHGHQRKALEELVEWLATEKPDAVWLSTALLAGLAPRITERLGIPVFGSLQGEDTFLDSLPTPWRERCWAELATASRSVAAYVSPSRYYAELMSPRMELRPEQVRVIPNGVSREGYLEPAPATPPVIGFLARFIEGKGLSLVVHAFVELCRRNKVPGVRLRCFGAQTPGDERYVAQLQAELAAAGLADRVDWHPNVSREEKLEHLRTLSMLTVPTQYGEAFGLFLVEAMAAGVPVVQPRTAAFTEIVEQSGAGVLYDPAVPLGLVEAWEALLGDPARARALGAQGRAAAAGEYSLERLAERVLEVSRGLKPEGEDAKSSYV